MKLKAEIGIPGIVKAQIEYVKRNANKEKYETGDRGVSSAGDSGVSSSRGSSAVGANGVSVVRGNSVKVKGGIGAVLVIVEECCDSYNISAWKAVVVDGKKVKADTWYKLVNGELVEVEEDEK